MSSRIFFRYINDLTISFFKKKWAVQYEIFIRKQTINHGDRYIHKWIFTFHSIVIASKHFWRLPTRISNLPKFPRYFRNVLFTLSLWRSIVENLKVKLSGNLNLSDLTSKEKFWVFLYLYQLKQCQFSDSHCSVAVKYPRRANGRGGR